MTPANRSIFRASALEGYMQARAQTVLPRFIAPPAPVCLWLLLSCFIALSTLVWLARVPVYRLGKAAVITRTEMDHAGDGAMVVAFFPAESKSELQIGQSLSFKLDADQPVLVRKVTGIEIAVLSPTEIRQKFGLDDAGVRLYERPAAVVVARLGTPDEKLPASAYQGVVMDTKIEVGSQRLVSLLPLVGKLFQSHPNPR